MHWSEYLAGLSPAVRAALMSTLIRGTCRTAAALSAAGGENRVRTVAQALASAHAALLTVRRMIAAGPVVQQFSGALLPPRPLPPPLSWHDYVAALSAKDATVLLTTLRHTAQRGSYLGALVLCDGDLSAICDTLDATLTSLAEARRRLATPPPA